MSMLGMLHRPKPRDGQGHPGCDVRHLVGGAGY
jgi:hypothetical protein